MSFLDKLHDHCGGLIRIKSELYWYKDSGLAVRDGNPDRICLVLNDKDGDIANTKGVAARSVRAFFTRKNADVKLLIDGSSQIVWLEEQDVEFLAQE
jgi:hypothetical protein